MTEVSVIIVNYNVKQLLLQCLASVYAGAADLQPEVIVVDNNSGDGSMEAVKDLFPSVIRIENKFNAGFSAANNQGIKAASGKYIFLLNPDTELVGDALVQLRSCMETDPGVAIAGPKLLNTDGSLQVSAWKEHKPVDMFLETFFLHKLIHRLEYPLEDFNSDKEVMSLSGAALFFRRSLIEKTGGLNEDLFWMEDMELCSRARHEGKLIYLASAKVIHHSGQSQKKNYSVAISNQLLSKLKYYRVNNSYPGYCMAVIFCLVFIISRCIVFTLLIPAGSLYRLKSKAYFYTLNKYFRYIFLGDKRVT
jgi:GT2 family glycosyltransferase